jgi:ubiquinone/menaquinone biosynthesis C-methylase UbiE
MNPTTDPSHTPQQQMKHRARREFDAWANNYDRSILNTFLFKPSYITLMEEIGRWQQKHQRPFRVLDIGCGTGTLAILLGRSPWPVKVVGLDYSANMCVAATAKVEPERHGHDIRFVNGDSEHLPFADNSFDMVTCSNSFHHYPHQQTVVHEMARLLTPEGRVILIDGFRDCVIGWFVFDVVIERVEGDIHHAPWPIIHDYFVTAGLRNIHRRKFNFLMPALATIADKQDGPSPTTVPTTSRDLNDPVPINSAPTDPIPANHTQSPISDPQP